MSVGFSSGSNQDDEDDDDDDDEASQAITHPGPHV